MTIKPIDTTHKILSTLSLSASNTREDTLKSIIYSVLFNEKKVNNNDLVDKINNEFKFTPYSQELEDLVSSLVKAGTIVKDSEGDLHLSEDARIDFGKKEVDLTSKEKKRFENFSNYLKTFEDNISEAELRLLWDTLIVFFYDNFYDYGEEARKRLHPHIEYDQVFDKDTDYYQIAFSKLKKPKLCELFKIAVNKFSEYATTEDIDFINSLAEKTISFTSLGMNPEDGPSNVEISKINWVLYLDTNVLYSLLDLHSHPENDACKALIKLINDNKEHLNITLRYSELTDKELKLKRDDFNSLDANLSESAANALLRSNKLDDFSAQYYTSLLADKSNTIHPSDTIDIAPRVLKFLEILLELQLLAKIL